MCARFYHIKLRAKTASPGSHANSTLYGRLKYACFAEGYFTSRHMSLRLCLCYAAAKISWEIPGLVFWVENKVAVTSNYDHIVIVIL